MSTVMFGTFGTFFPCHRRIAASTGMQLILAFDNRANVMSNMEECVVVDDSTARPPFHKITLRSGVLSGAILWISGMEDALRSVPKPI